MSFQCDSGLSFPWRLSHTGVRPFLRLPPVALMIVASPEPRIQAARLTSLLEALSTWIRTDVHIRNMQVRRAQVFH